MAYVALMNSVIPAIHVVVAPVLAFSGALLFIYVCEVNGFLMNLVYALRGTLSQYLGVRRFLTAAM